MAAEMRAIELAAAARFPEDVLPPALREETTPEEELADAARRGGLWAAFAGTKMVGFAYVKTLGSLALLAEMDVLPDYGRRGIGRALAARAAEYVREQGHSALHLTTFSHIPWNAPFYHRLGYRILTDGETPEALRAILAEEAAAGLRNRVAMRLTFADSRLK